MPLYILGIIFVLIGVYPFCNNLLGLNSIIDGSQFIILGFIWITILLFSLLLYLKRDNKEELS